jgi:hypothetical protein
MFLSNQLFIIVETRVPGRRSHASRARDARRNIRPIRRPLLGAFLKPPALPVVTDSVKKIMVHDNGNIYVFNKRSDESSANIADLINSYEAQVYCINPQGIPCQSDYLIYSISVPGIMIDGALFQEDGKIVMNSHRELGTDQSIRFDRIFPDGSPDVNFGNGYQARSSTWEIGTYRVRDLMLANNGDFLISGGTYLSGGEPGNFILRFTTEGLWDTGFGDGGKLLFPGSFIHDLEMSHDDKILALDPSRLMRFTSAGEWDLDFNQDGIFELPMTHTGHEPLAMFSSSLESVEIFLAPEKKRRLSVRCFH